MSTDPGPPGIHDTWIEQAGSGRSGVFARCTCGWWSMPHRNRSVSERQAREHVSRALVAAGVSGDTEDQQ